MFDRNKVGFSGFWFEGLESKEEVTRVCEDLAKLGYKGVEWKETCFGTGAEACSRLDMAVKATRNAGIEVTDLVILRNLVSPDNWQKQANDTCEFIKAACGAGVKVVNIASGPVLSGSVPSDEWWRPACPDWRKSWETLEKTMEPIISTAESMGVTIAFEPIAGSLVHDYYSIMELLRRVQSPSLGITMDPSHFLIHDNDIACAIRQLSSRICLVHVKDAVGRPGAFGRDFLFPILGEGAINWQEFFAALDDIDYPGWLSVEFESFKYMHEVLKGDALEAARLSKMSYDSLATDKNASRPPQK
ncbi:MAG: sugar phosphate isomerase/epimerase [Armatimonadetes bacterium]|nr:sugar phosphate isomerase/epimerase [Armatimonadota bacterium]